MIGRIAGLLVEKQAPFIMVDVNGLGYEVQVPMTTYYSLPELEKPVVLHAHQAISETSQQLFGFTAREDREFFRLLIKVNGVGPKMAVGIMSMETRELIGHIRSENVTALTKVPGVGKKTAERLVIDMRDKIKAWQADNPTMEIVSAPVEAPAAASSDVSADAESALIALGYKPTEAAKAIAKVYSDEITRSEDLIRLALKSMLPA